MWSLLPVEDFFVFICFLFVCAKCKKPSLMSLGHMQFCSIFPACFFVVVGPENCTQFLRLSVLNNGVASRFIFRFYQRSAHIEVSKLSGNIAGKVHHSGANSCFERCTLLAICRVVDSCKSSITKIFSPSLVCRAFHLLLALMTSKQWQTSHLGNFLSITHLSKIFLIKLKISLKSF